MARRAERPTLHRLDPLDQPQALIRRIGIVSIEHDQRELIDLEDPVGEVHQVITRVDKVRWSTETQASRDPAVCERSVFAVEIEHDEARVLQPRGTFQ